MLERRIAKLQAGYSNAAWTMKSFFTPDALPGNLTSAQCVDKMIEVMHEYDALTTSPQTKGNTKPLGGDALLDGLFYLNVSSNGNMTASLGDLHMQKQRQDALFASATVVGVAAIHAYGSDPGVAKGNPDAGVGKVTSQDYAAGGFKTGNTQATNAGVVEGAGGKWFDAEGNPKWPINNGFEGTPLPQTLQPGTIVDRYGGETGKFVSPEGIPYSNRALPPGSETRPYNIYEVVKPTDVQSGKIASWFDQPGGGIQYQFSQSIESLINEGYLRRLP